MRKLTVITLFVLAACGGGPQSRVSSVPGQGAVSISVVPNPIVAARVSGDTYEFPFDVVVRETGGRSVNVTRVTATVFGPGGLNVGSESWDADRIRALGYNTTVNANSELRYRFTPRKNVPDERLLESLTAELKVEATDDTGNATSASTAVTVRKS